MFRVLFRLACVLGLAAAAALPASTASAHPHIFIRAHAELQFENGKIVGMIHEWVFDDFFSSALIQDFDANKNKQFDGAEIQALHDGAFRNLKEFGYFTHLRVDNKPVEIASVKDFTPSITKEGRVMYRFAAVFPAPIDPRTAKFDASIHDSSFYVDVDLNPSIGVKLTGGGAEACKFAVTEDRNSPLYFGAGFPRRIEILCGKN